MTPVRWLVASGWTLALLGCDPILGLDKSYSESACFPRAECSDSGADAGQDATTSPPEAGPDGPQAGDASGPRLSVASANLDFSTVTVGQTLSPGTVNVTNVGHSASASLQTSVAGAAFRVSSDGCKGKALAAMGSCQIQVSLDDSMPGMQAGSLTVTDSAADEVTVTLQADVLTPGSLSISPQSEDFMGVDVGKTSSHDFVVTNGGSAPSGTISIVLTPTNGTQSSEFTLGTDSCSGKPLAANAMCTFGVTFTPAAVGPRSASLVVNASPGGPAAASLAGQGLETVTLTITETGTGTGLVVDGAGKINCGNQCTATYTRNGVDPMVTLTAMPGTSSRFAAWNGGGCSGTGTCSVTLTASTTVDAIFNASELLSVNLRALGNLSGSITSNPSGISCTANGDACSASAEYDQGTAVTLSVTGLSAAPLAAWLPGTCTGSTCSVTMSGPQTVNYTAVANNIVFVTSKQFTGNLGGVSGAQGSCAQAAMSAGLPGHYVPWLATSVSSAVTALGSANGWVRLDGLPFANAIGTSGGTTGLVNGQVYYPPEITELGTVHAGAVWTSAQENGAVVFGGDTCSDWTSASSTAAAFLGDSSAGSTDWTWFSSPSCSANASIYCFGTDLTSTVTVAPQSGRHAFLSAGTFAPSSGLAAADTLCQNEAAGAGLANASHFLAFLAAVGATAAQRFDLSGAPWVRVDGVPLASSAASLTTAPMLLAALSVHADGTYTTQEYATTWSGSSTPTTAATAQTTCNNWASTAGTGFYGYAGSTANWFIDNAFTGTSCSTALPVYCFEN